MNADMRKGRAVLARAGEWFALEQDDAVSHVADQCHSAAAAERALRARYWPEPSRATQQLRSRACPRALTLLVGRVLFSFETARELAIHPKTVRT